MAVVAATPSLAAGGPKYAGIVVDARTGNVLYSQDADTLHYPASLTKMMTLYLTFEALEAKRISLDSAVPISAKAAAQAPTKLGARAGSTITVEQAILSMVTLSANDAAMALGEFVGGSEDGFATMMNNKARALGMTRTTYRNPNGLPNTAQMTTARDQARLGIALREHFPQYFGYFSTRSFQFGNRVIGNHNHLLGSVRGVDGIKTGYTRAAGFNLVSSVNVDGKSMIGVVLGGASTPARDNQMRRLIATYLPKASGGGASSNLIAQSEPEKPNVAAAALRMAAAGDVGRSRNVPTPDSRYQQPSSVAAFAAITPRSANPLVVGKQHKQNAPTDEVASIAPAYGSDNQAEGSAVDSLTTASTPVPAKPAKGSKASPAKAEVEKSDKAPSGWVVQVGVSPNRDMANDLLQSARSKGGRALQNAKPYAVAVDTGGDTLYRARFGGFEDQRQAVNACKALKSSGVKCWASMQ